MSHRCPYQRDQINNFSLLNISNYVLNIFNFIQTFIFLRDSLQSDYFKLPLYSFFDNLDIFEYCIYLGKTIFIYFKIL